MDPNQLDQINQLNNLNNISMYQNYLLNNENKLDPQANLNLYYNYQQYYKEAAKNNMNLGAIGLNPLQNSFIQNSESSGIIQNNLTQSPLNISNSKALGDDTPNFNIRADSEEKSHEESSVVSHSQFDNQIFSYEMSKESNNIHTHIESDPNCPWNKASKDPSIIQKGTELFVGNLSLETTDFDLYETFKDCGEVIDVIYYLTVID